MVRVVGLAPRQIAAVTADTRSAAAAGNGGDRPGGRSTGAGARERSSSTAISYNSLVKIYTRTGDTGETSLFERRPRVAKDDPRVDAYGEVDELNAWLGLVRASRLDPALDAERRSRCSAICSRSAPSSPIPADKLAPRVTKAVIDDDARRAARAADRSATRRMLPPLRALHSCRRHAGRRRAARRADRLPPRRTPDGRARRRRSIRCCFATSTGCPTCCSSMARAVNHRGGASGDANGRWFGAPIRRSMSA